MVNVKLRADLPEWYAKDINPNRTVPALQFDDGRVISESLIVAEYLDEAYPANKVRRSDPYEHAQEKLAIETFSKVVPFFYKLVLGPAETFQESQDKFSEALGLFLNGHLGEKRFLGGETASYADYMVWPWLERLEYLQQHRSVKIAEAIADRLQAYVDRMRDVPAVKQVLLPTGTHAKFYEGYITGNPNWDAHLE